MLKHALLCLIFLKCLRNAPASNLISLTSNAVNRDVKINNGTVCILKIVKQNIPCGNIVTTISVGSFDNVIEGLNDENCHTLVIRSIERQNWLMSTDVYLMLLNSAPELTLALLEVSRDLLWNPAAKFIIAVYDIEDDDKIIIFSELLRHRIYNVIVFSFFDYQTFTYFPYANKNCGRKIEHIVTLNYCIDDSDTSNTLFQYINLNDYRRCPIVVGVKEVVPYAIVSKNSNLNVADEYKVGTEQLLMENIAKLERIEIKYIYFSGDVFRGIVLENNTATGMMSYLQNGEMSAVIGGFTLILNRITVFDYVWGYNYATFKILTRAATDKVWKKVYRTFSIQSWSLITTSFCLMYITTISILILFSKTSEDPVNIFLKLLDYFFAHSDQQLFTNRNLRLLLLVWIWYTYFINSFYNTAYYSLITGHVKEKRNYNFQNLTTFPYKPCISQFGKSYFLYGYNLTFPNSKFIQECETTEGSLDYVAEKDDYYAFATEYSYYRDVDKYIDSVGNNKLDSWEILDATISTVYCSRGFPLRRRFQKHAMHIFESGIIKYHLGMMKVNRKHLTQYNNYFKSMHIGDFVVSYCILVIGSIISSICFLFERCYKNYVLKPIP